jgi:hypothetical protein
MIVNEAASREKKVSRSKKGIKELRRNKRVGKTELVVKRNE